MFFGSFLVRNETTFILLIFFVLIFLFYRYYLKPRMTGDENDDGINNGGASD
ncbi:unnamed protein product, partial [Brugia timori]